MKKTIAIVLTAATLLGTAAPALAGPFGDGDADSRDFAAFGVLSTLQQRGVPVTAVEEYGENILAYVQNDQGQTKMVILDPATLKPITR